MFFAPANLYEKIVSDLRTSYLRAKKKPRMRDYFLNTCYIIRAAPSLYGKKVKAKKVKEAVQKCRHYLFLFVWTQT